MPITNINQTDAVLLHSPKTKSYNPYDEKKYRLAINECCVYDVVDCILSQDIEEKEYKTDKVRSANHNLSLEFENFINALVSLSNDVKNSREYTIQTILPIFKAALKNLANANLFFDVVYNWYENTNPDDLKKPKTFLKWAMLFVKFREEGSKFAIQNLVAEKLLAEMNLLSKNEKKAYIGDMEKQLSRPLNFLETQFIPVRILQSKLIDTYGFQTEQAWNPPQTIDAFITQIRNHGFLGICGAFHQDFFSEKPVPAQMGSQLVLHAAQGEFETAKAANRVHFILVIGASTKTYLNSGIDFIYYIDPGKDYDKKTYPVYILEYDLFCKLITTVKGDRFEDKVIEQNFINKSNNSYILYHPDRAPKLTVSKEQNKTCLSSTTAFWNRYKKEITLATGIATTVAAVAINTLSK